ncbi:MAG: hypothetical protein E7624_00410 [Ruminococcaceae bacterium]|nr:hypothetical protein [Oscillospiraceae bacterium]
MKNAPKKIIAAFLALFLTLSGVWILPVAASEEGGTRFVFTTLAGKDDETFTLQDDSFSLPVNGESSFRTSELSFLEGSSNALYVSLINQSGATKLSVTISYVLYEELFAETAEKNIEPASTAKQSFVLGLPHIGADVTELEITLSGNGAGGTLTLLSLFNLSSYVRDASDEATLSRCHYNKESGEIEISGELSYAATVRYEGESLALFSLAEGEDMHLSSKTPIARTGISFDFSFTVSVQSSSDLFSRYVVAAITSSGERVPLCTPTYPSFAPAETKPAEGFKGYHTEDFGAVMELTPDMAVVDVYLDRMQGVQNGGILYAGEFDYYYFDQTYVAELDRNVQNLAGIGAKVYLRFLVSSDAKGLSFVDEAPNGVLNRLPVVRTEAAQHDLYAMIDFLSTRYAQSGITGVILGRAADLVSNYSYTAATDLASYSALYATTLHLIVGAARRNIPNLHAVVPVSDAIWPEDADSLHASRDFYTALFLPSLLAALEAHVLEPQPFGVMLESRALADRWSASETGFFGIDRLQQFVSGLQALAAQSSYLETTFIFSWLPDATQSDEVLRAEYLLKYAALHLEGAVSTFLVDFSLAEREGKPSGRAAISYLARYIDTDNYAQAATTALQTLGIKSIAELYPALAETDFRSRLVYRVALSTTPFGEESAPKGSHPLWNFTTATDVMDWYSGPSCTLLSVLAAPNGGHALTATLSGAGAYGEMAYHFNAPVNLSFAPMISLQLGVIGEADTRYEVQLRLIGEDTTLYASAVLHAGENSTFYLDLYKNILPLTSLKCVRVMARPLDGQQGEYTLQMNHLTLHSKSLGSAELADRINAVRQNADKETQQAQERDYTVPVVVTAVIVLSSIAILSLLLIGQKAKKYRKNKASKEKRKAKS